MDTRRVRQTTREKRLPKRSSNDAKGRAAAVTGERSQTGTHVVLHESSGAAEVVCEHCGHDKFVFRPKVGTAGGGRRESTNFSPDGDSTGHSSSRGDSNRSR